MYIWQVGLVRCDVLISFQKSAKKVLQPTHRIVGAADVLCWEDILDGTWVCVQGEEVGVAP